LITETFKTQNLSKEFIKEQFDKCVEEPTDKRVIRDKRKRNDLMCRKELFELLMRLAPTEYPDSIEI